MPRHFKVHDLLGSNPKELQELEDLARDPSKTVDDCWEWMQVRGYVLSRTAVWAWLSEFRLVETTRRSKDVARQFLEAAREGDPTIVTEASLRRFEELVFENLVGSDGSDALELQRIARALKTGLSGRQAVNELRQRYDVEAGKLSEKIQAKREITQEDLDRVSKAVWG